MKITKSQLKQIIKEELFRLMEDFDDPTMTGRWTDKGPVYNCDALKAEIDEAAEDVAGRPAGSGGQGYAMGWHEKLKREYQEKCGKGRQ